MYEYSIEVFGSSRSQRTLQSPFTEQFFSKSLFTDTKNCRSQLHENKLPPPHIMFDDVLDRKQCFLHYENVI